MLAVTVRTSIARRPRWVDLSPAAPLTDDDKALRGAAEMQKYVAGRARGWLEFKSATPAVLATSLGWSPSRLDDVLGMREWVTVTEVADLGVAIGR